MASQERTMPFIKNLASSDRKIRTSALASLQTFLSSRQTAASLTPLDILKLWKGLFFALWMCDRAIPQQTLCQELADLIYVLPRNAVVPWLRGFWATMSREWTGIDVLRMEKFLLLVRRVVGAGFSWMKNAEKEKKGKGKTWEEARVEDVLGLLKEWPFSLDEEVEMEVILGQEGEQQNGASQKIPAGLRLHVLDIWVDEAEKVGLLEKEDEEAAKILQRLCEQVDVLEQKTTSPAVRYRSKDSLADERLQAKAEGDTTTLKDADMADAGDSGSWDGFDD
ncbi:nucleolar protein,Nop52-domain-containing protein [Podospora aff. communis PSN243]|uniref:Nucleolar protein,Nop52-domain-containing protein n=1 Tax=Podospora aff. communis PSN243 TaxID=3040156 RepID=A0AAV9GDX6_9PEZI|nr:nucleolar protein,Nop52-domain-containing protein [Podospora aff. communis PSN243]